MADLRRFLYRLFALFRSSRADDALDASIFAVVDWVIVRPLPYAQPHQLVRVRVQPSSAMGSTTAAALLTPGEFARLSPDIIPLVCGLFATLAASTIQRPSISAGGRLYLRPFADRLCGGPSAEIQ